MVIRRSWISFSSRVIGGFLSVLQDESIVVKQGQRVSGELIEFRVAQLQRRLRLTGRGDLVQEISYVIGTKSAGGESFFEGGSDLLRAISAKQSEKFLKLAEEVAVRVGQPAQVSFDRFRRANTLEQFQQSLLCFRT
jgi:hypothetical protein